MPKAISLSLRLWVVAQQKPEQVESSQSSFSERLPSLILLVSVAWQQEHADTGDQYCGSPEHQRAQEQASPVRTLPGVREKQGQGPCSSRDPSCLPSPSEFFPLLSKSADPECVLLCARGRHMMSFHPLGNNGGLVLRRGRASVSCPGPLRTRRAACRTWRRERGRGPQSCSDWRCRVTVAAPRGNSSLGGRARRASRRRFHTCSALQVRLSLRAEAGEGRRREPSMRKEGQRCAGWC